MDLYRSLYDLARLLLAESDADRTAELLLGRVREITGAERGFIVVREGERFVQKLDFEYDRARLGADERRFSRSIVKLAIESRELVATESPSEDVRFVSAESVEAIGRRSVRAVPFAEAADDGRIVGVLYLERRAGPFSEEVDAFLREVAVSAAALLGRALDREALRRRNRELERDLFAQYDFRDIQTRDPGMLALLRMVAQVADSDASILIRGETGTGKELIARALHVNSARRRKPFVVVHCSALPATLLESELFGHVRGAFTGAERDRPGRIAQAASGTLFLDEIGELSVSVQVKLLRVLQEGEYEPVGGTTQRANFRLIAATNRDLMAEVEAGRFREDLFYRLNVIAITCPTLAQRRDDIPLLVDHFLSAYCRKNNRPVMAVTREAMDRLMAYDWPGNVRELENAIERAVVLSKGPSIGPDNLPRPIAQAEATGRELSFPVGTPLEEIERRVIHATLSHTGGDKRLAAQLLGIATRTIYRKLAADEVDA